MARESDPPPPHDKLNVKTGPPLVDIMIFSTVLVSVGCHFFAFFGMVSLFFSQKRHLRHPGALLFLNLFSECWLVALYGGQWAPSAKFCLPWPKPLATPLDGKCPFCPSLGTPMRSLTILYQVPQTRPAHLMKRRNVFD